MAQLIVRPVQGGLRDGSLITIQGATSPTADGFSINLSTGPGDIGSTDIALHVNPRFNQNCTPRNSFQNGNWGAEDRAGPPGVPVQKGSPFECIMLVQADKYMVSFNGQHFCEFNHRIPKERVTHVVIKGDAQVNNVLFSGAGAPPPGGQPAFGHPAPAAGLAAQSGMQRQPIPGGMAPGRIVYINGTPAPNAQRFGINLKHQEHGGDLALHFNPRFNEGAVAKNNLANGSWGQEERATAPFPFVPGTPFQMMILGDPHELKIAVNGAHFTEFRLRDPNLQAIQWIEVEGDITNVQIHVP